VYLVAKEYHPNPLLPRTIGQRRLYKTGDAATRLNALRMQSG
jgi:hypothetical protein